MTPSAAYAVGLWRNATPLPGTLGEQYFIKQRKLDVRQFDLHHCLRWNENARTIIALMQHPMTDTPCGIHRTFLNEDGSKRERKMLGKQGVEKLTADEDVTLGIGITEGVEDGLAVLLSGWAPIWAATSAGSLAKFPIFHGIESLTIFADADSTGLEAAQVCVGRWLVAGREARISYLKEIVCGGN
jgi:putative DNA primase/helicase